MLFPLLLACGSAQVPLAQPPPTAYMGPESPSTRPEPYSPELAGAAMEQGLWLLAGLDVSALSDPWEAQIRDALKESSRCPQYTETTIEDGFWEAEWYTDGCEASDGRTATGYGSSTRYTYADGVEEYLYAEGTLGSTEGWSVGGFGYLGSSRYREDEGHSLSQYLYGDLSYTGPEAQGTWLEQSAGAWLESYLWWSPGGLWAELSGGLSLGQGPFVAMVTQDLQAWPSSWGNPCPIEPRGTLSVRDDQGLWYTLVFDAAPDDDDISHGVCDGCAQIFVDEVTIGEACLDLEFLTDRGSWP